MPLQESTDKLNQGSSKDKRKDSNQKYDENYLMPPVKISTPGKLLKFQEAQKALKAQRGAEKPEKPPKSHKIEKSKKNHKSDRHHKSDKTKSDKTKSDKHKSDKHKSDKHKSHKSDKAQTQKSQDSIPVDHEAYEMQSQPPRFGDLDLERDYTGTFNLPDEDKPEERKRWNIEGNEPITDIRLTPEGWTSVEMDIDPSDVDSQIVRCHERLEENIMPMIFQDRMKGLMQQKAEKEARLKKWPGLDWDSVQRLESLHQMKQSYRKVDKFNQLPNVEALIEAYESKRLVWNNSLVTYWSHGVQRSKPRPFDWDEYYVISGELGSDSSFWVEGVQGPGSSSEFMGPRGGYPNVNWATLPPNMPGFLRYFGQSVRFDPGQDSSLDLMYADDTGADLMTIYEGDLDVLSKVYRANGLASPRINLLGGHNVRNANGEETSREMIVVAVNIRDAVNWRPVLTNYVPVQCSLIPGTFEENGSRPRLNGPWMRYRLYTGSIPDLSGRLLFARGKDAIRVLFTGNNWGEGNSKVTAAGPPTIPWIPPTQLQMVSGRWSVPLEQKVLAMTGPGGPHGQPYKTSALGLTVFPPLADGENLWKEPLMGENKYIAYNHLPKGTNVPLGLSEGPSLDFKPAEQPGQPSQCCIQCRDRNWRCDGNIPCENCVNHHLQFACRRKPAAPSASVPVSSQPSSSKPPPPGNTQTFEERLEEETQRILAPDPPVVPAIPTTSLEERHRLLRESNPFVQPPKASMPRMSTQPQVDYWTLDDPLSGSPMSEPIPGDPLLHPTPAPLLDDQTLGNLLSDPSLRDMLETFTAEERCSWLEAGQSLFPQTNQPSSSTQPPVDPTSQEPAPPDQHAEEQRQSLKRKGNGEEGNKKKNK